MQRLSKSPITNNKQSMVDNSGSTILDQPEIHAGWQPNRDEHGMTAIERASQWRAEWKVSGWPPGVNRKRPFL